MIWKERTCRSRLSSGDGLAREAPTQVCSSIVAENVRMRVFRDIVCVTALSTVSYCNVGRFLSDELFIRVGNLNARVPVQLGGLMMAALCRTTVLVLFGWERFYAQNKRGSFSCICSNRKWQAKWRASLPMPKMIHCSLQLKVGLETRPQFLKLRIETIIWHSKHIISCA